MTYEIYYSDGGHIGPFASLQEAKDYANKVLEGISLVYRASAEIRPIDSKVIGGYRSNNVNSVYLRNYRTHEENEILAEFGEKVLRILKTEYDDTLESVENAALASGLLSLREIASHVVHDLTAKSAFNNPNI
jgi:hypothetical protein